MGIRIKSKPDLARMKQRIESGLIDEMKAVALDNLEEIKTRTVSRGLDVKGSAFAQYSPKYKRFKAEKTKSNAGRVNLVLSGRMMQSLQIAVVQRGTKIVAKIFPSSNKEALKVSGNMRYREFFAISDEQVKAFRDRIANFIGRRLK